MLCENQMRSRLDSAFTTLRHYTHTLDTMISSSNSNSKQISLLNPAARELCFYLRHHLPGSIPIFDVFYLPYTLSCLLPQCRVWDMWEGGVLAGHLMIPGSEALRQHQRVRPVARRWTLASSRDFSSPLLCSCKESQCEQSPVRLGDHHPTSPT